MGAILAKGWRNRDRDGVVEVRGKVNGLREGSGREGWWRDGGGRPARRAAALLRSTRREGEEGEAKREFAGHIVAPLSDEKLHRRGDAWCRRRIAPPQTPV